MTATAKDVLVRARELLSKGWCQGDFARNDAGEERPISHPEATHFCLLGAVQRASYDLEVWSLEPHLWARWALRKALRSDALGIMNDDPNTTQEKVLQLVDQAILEESQP